MKRQRALAAGLTVIGLAAVAGLLAKTRQMVKTGNEEVPLARVQRGDLDIRVYATGELRAHHVMVLTAPPVGGGALQITRLLHTGAAVKKGDIVFEFDPAEQRYNLEQSRSELLEAQQEITKAMADAAVQAAQDKVALLKARFDARRAELEVGKNELVSGIDAQKNNLALEQARRALTQLQQDIESHTASGHATIVLAREKENKAKLAMDQAQLNIKKMLVAAPMDGLVSIERNIGAMQIITAGMSVPDYRAGDQAQSGSPIAQVIDPTQMELTCKIGEQERSNVKVGQSAEVEFDALPGLIFPGTVQTAGGMSTKLFWEANTQGKFDITIQLSNPDRRLRPGLTAQIVFLGDKRKNVLYVPRLALFMRDGKRVVYRKDGTGFEQREVKIQSETESRVAVEGLKTDDQVALLDPRRRSETLMAAVALAGERRRVYGFEQWLPDLQLGLQNLLLHRLRSLLTMLGMIFGVAAVVTMLSIGAGARQKVMAIIEQMGVRNLIVEAKETPEWQAHQKLRSISPGLTLEDYRVIGDDVDGIVASTPRKRFIPTKTIPPSQQEVPAVYGVRPVYEQVAKLRLLQGRFFDPGEESRADPVCVLGVGARSNLFGASDPMGQYVKLDQQWFRVIGVAGPQLSMQAEIAGLPSQDLNNVIYVPLNAVILRLENTYSDLRDDIDGIYLNLNEKTDMSGAAQVVRAVLESSHHGAGDYSVIVPAELLAEQEKTERLFNAVMVAIASISLLVGGIGIMNIMLASILERTREIGLRRAVGARQSDVVRQFVTEAVMISLVGGSFGIVFGFVMSRLIAWLAGWSTIVTPASILLAFFVSISVGLVFGIYPAVQAARLDPVEAIRYE